MKIKIMLFILSAVCAFAQAPVNATLSARANAIKAEFNQAVKDKHGNAYLLAAEMFDVSHVADYNALIASISALPAKSASWVALRNAKMLNGSAKTWTQGLAPVKAYAYPQYIAYAGTLAEAQAYAALDNAEPSSVKSASNRLGNAALWDDFCLSRLGKGEMSKDYQFWFKRHLVSLSAQEQLDLIAAEIDALWAGKKPSPQRDAWLVELRSGQILKKGN